MRTPDIIQITAGGHIDILRVARTWGVCANCGNAHLAHLPGPLRLIGVYRFANPFAGPGTGPEDICTRCIAATEGITLISGPAGIVLA